MQSVVPAASGILDMQAMLMQNFRLVEAAMVIGEWKKASTVEEENPNNMNNRITSRNIFGLMGSATEEQALAMLKAKEDERVEAADAAAKKDQAKEKKAKGTTALVTTGSEILKRLEQLGPSELLRLKIDELYALAPRQCRSSSFHSQAKQENRARKSQPPAHCSSRSLSLFSGSSSFSSIAAFDSRGSCDLRGIKYT